ncbi:MAG: hypothetical protein ACKO2V_01665 [Snowella sp.]
MAIATASPILINEIIPYSLLEGGEQPTFGNRSVEKFLLSAKEALQQTHPDNISLVIAVAPGQKLVNEPWTRRYKPDSITFYTFFNKDNTFAAIETLSKIIAPSYRETKILALIDPLPTKMLQDVHRFSGEIKARLSSSGCILYSASGK